MIEQSLENIILALLFASEEPLTVKRISSVVDGVHPTEIEATLESLRARFGGEHGSIVLERVAGGYQLSTSPRYSDFVARLYSGRRKQRLSRAGMEVLAIIAYKQPITRAEIEHVRGVGCGGVLTTLMERGLIKIRGKAKVLGAPFLYGTTPDFLEYLGLDSLKDLPSMEELESLLEREESARREEDVTPEAEPVPMGGDGERVAGDGAPGKEEADEGLTGGDEETGGASVHGATETDSVRGKDLDSIHADRQDQ